MRSSSVCSDRNLARINMCSYKLCLMCVVVCVDVDGDLDGII